MESTIYIVAGKEFELQHHGVKGMKWGVRRKDRIRSSSPAYDTKTGKWTREPEGGSIGKQVAVNKAKSLKAKRTAKKALKEGYAEYKTFEKDMHNLHGSSRKYSLDKNTGKYVDRKTGKTIEDYEYKGLQSYESARKSRNISVSSKVGIALQTIGTMYVADVTLTGGAVTRSVAKAGKAAVKNAMSKVGDTIFDYSVLDASGKVLRRFN